jgi:hypothetical protein
MFLLFYCYSLKNISFCILYMSALLKYLSEQAELERTFQRAVDGMQPNVIEQQLIQPISVNPNSNQNSYYDEAEGLLLQYINDKNIVNNIINKIDSVNPDFVKQLVINFSSFEGVFDLFKNQSVPIDRLEDALIDAIKEKYFTKALVTDHLQQKQESDLVPTNGQLHDQFFQNGHVNDEFQEPSILKKILCKFLHLSDKVSDNTLIIEFNKANSQDLQQIEDYGNKLHHRAPVLKRLDVDIKKLDKYGGVPLAWANEEINRINHHLSKSPFYDIIKADPIRSNEKRIHVNYTMSHFRKFSTEVLMLLSFVELGHTLIERSAKTINENLRQLNKNKKERLEIDNTLGDFQTKLVQKNYGKTLKKATDAVLTDMRKHPIDLLQNAIVSHGGKIPINLNGDLTKDRRVLNIVMRHLISKTPIDVDKNIDLLVHLGLNKDPTFDVLQMTEQEYLQVREKEINSRTGKFNDRVYGHGLNDDHKFPLTDKVYINKKTLQIGGSLEIRYHKNNHIGLLKPMVVGGAMKKILNNYMDKKPFENELYHKLGPTEKHLLTTMNNSYNMGLDIDDDNMNDEFNVLRGEWIAGNNSTVIAHKLRKYILYYADIGKMTKFEAMKLLNQLGV